MKKSKRNSSDIRIAKILDKNSPFAVRESFNQLRTNLMYTITEGDSCPVFAITSVSESSGKSTIIANLAYSFTQIGKKVLLVDGDMRCPVIYRFFHTDPQHAGLSEVISGIQSDVIQKEILPGLDLITSGRIPPNPSELLTSQRLKDLIAAWKQTYDIIFFDFPPVGVVTDAVAICQDITGYIFDVRSGHNSAKDVNATLEGMEQLGAKIVGIVLNDYNLKGSSGYYSSRYSKHGKYSKYGRYSKYNRYSILKYEQSLMDQSAENAEEKASDQ